MADTDANGKVMTGARAKVFVNGKPVGIFTNISWGLTFVAEPIFILGAYGPVESVYTAQDAVQISASGWRVIDHGPHKEPSVPTLSELLTHSYLDIYIEDRKTGKKITNFRQCRPTSYNTTLANRQPSEVSITFIGLRCDDETATNNETANAATLP